MTTTTTTSPEQYFFPRRKPKNPSTGKKKTLLGLRREALISTWSDHVLIEHKWCQKPGADPEGQRDCAECDEHVTKIKASEQWT